MMKPGYKTTEFWVTLLLLVATLAGTLAGLIDGTWGAIAAAIEAAAYAASRVIAKKGTSNAELRAQVLDVLATRAAIAGNNGVPKHPGGPDAGAGTDT